MIRCYLTDFYDKQFSTHPSPKEDPRYLDTHRHASHTLAHHLSQYLPSDVSTQLCIVGRPLLIKPPYPRILSEEYRKNQQGMQRYIYNY